MMWVYPVVNTHVVFPHADVCNKVGRWVACLKCDECIVEWC